MALERNIPALAASWCRPTEFLERKRSVRLIGSAGSGDRVRRLFARSDKASLRRLFVRDQTNGSRRESDDTTDPVDEIEAALIDRTSARSIGDIARCPMQIGGTVLGCVRGSCVSEG